MFTFNIYLKLAAIAVCIIGGTVLAFTFGFWYAFPILLIGLLLFVSYVLLGTVQSAAQLMETGDLEATEKRLKLTLSPRYLYKTNRAYYFLIKGSIATQLNDTDAAEQYFHKAQNHGLPSDNERALVLMQLANIAVNKNNWNGAKLHLNQIKKLKVTDPNLKEQIREFNKAFKNRGVMRGSGMAGKKGFQAPGGKRRRPKMR